MSMVLMYVFMFKTVINTGAFETCNRVCTDWKWEWNWHNWKFEKVCQEWECEDTNPSPSPEVSPSPEISPEPSVSPEATPQPCTENCGVVPTFPHDIPVAINECHGDAPKAPIFSFNRLNPTTVELNWWPVPEVDHYGVIYGYTTENEMGIPFIDQNATQVTLNNLQANQNIFVRMMAEKSDHCMAWSEIVDP